PLTVLVLRGASVTGDIPYSLGNAYGLTVLSLAGNSITGNLPPTLGQLGNLTVLDLSGNSVSGSIPESVTLLGKLNVLDLSSNFVTGGVPESIGSLQLLKTLNLSNNSISGSIRSIPVTVGNLTSLSLLDLSLNSMLGSVPDLGKLKGLQLVTLNGNTFSGRLPNSLWSLQNLRFLDLSSNNFTGEFPDAVPANADANGTTFNLSDNFYYGAIPSGFSKFIFARFSVVDLSNNYFQGLVPVDSGDKNASLRLNCFKNASQQRSSMNCQVFYSQRGLAYDGRLSPAPSPLPSSPSSHKKSNWKWIVIGVVGGVFLLVLVIIALVLCIMKCRGGAQDIEQRDTSPNATSTGAVAQDPASRVSPSGGFPSGFSVNLTSVGDSFTFEQLVRATAEFSDTNFIRHGHSGDFYYGVFEGGIPVVVKRINLETVKKNGYAVELEVFSKVSHGRIVPFLGHCLDQENEKFLVYKYMTHGDLSNALYIKSAQEEEGLQSLDWITRLKIAIGVAEALCYLHHECMPPLVHRDVQASSILLDDKYEVRLGSLSEVCAQEGEGHQNVITRFLRLSSQTSEQSAAASPSATCAYDVYCLGKVLLELVTGKLGISSSNGTSTTEWLDKTLQYINIYDKELVTKIVDPSLIVDEDLLEEVWAMAIVAKSCLNPKPSKRPLMRYILKALENPLKVVREDSTGSARLRAGSSRGSWNAALFGSWRHSSSDIASASGPPLSSSLKRSGTMRSQGSGGEQSFNNRRPSKEIFPEPSGTRDVVED
ncbi:probable LRR receptor-like serine/threonine-protein kinase At2g16250, partial [Asparagus officinalis]|uniref:probable LRR receptor-like serine/threonine-protein kinase At2g16250 n=1 Tax=Asparagus officinalis TaxID=4686 RepID=UPI00098E8670